MGAKVQVFDPVAMSEAKHRLADVTNIEYCDNEYEALRGADAMLLITEWHQFRYPDFQRIANL